MQLDPEALRALKKNQRPLDADGCEVGVSRQALEELIAALAATKALLPARPAVLKEAAHDDA